MTRKKVFFVVFLVAAIILTGYAGFAVFAATSGQSEPGSAEDPLVTKSFVEKYVKDMLGSTGEKEFSWQIKNLEAGQEFIGRAGTEFIIRTGSAVIVDPTGSGLPDVTAGVNDINGRLAARNHLYLVPRADGRGIRAQSPVIVMYRGG